MIRIVGRKVFDAITASFRRLAEQGPADDRCGHEHRIPDRPQTGGSSGRLRCLDHRERRDCYLINVLPGWRICRF